MMYNPFTYGSMITDPQRFIGRRAELEFITGRLRGDQPQGSSIVGPRRIGKSSLLHYLTQPRSDESLCAAPGQQVIYLDAQKGECSSPERFRMMLGCALLAEQRCDRRTTEGRVLAELQAQLLNATECSWETARAVLMALPFHPVICLDEFEALLNEAFDEQFFNGLRSWANEGLLTWVIVSVKSLPELSQLYNHASPFFNLLATVELAELTATEADQLIDLAQVSHVAFTDDERKWLHDLTCNHPYQLQIVSWQLWQHKAANSPITERALRNFLYHQLNPPQHPLHPQLTKQLLHYQRNILWLLFFLLPMLLLIWQNWSLVHLGMAQIWHWLEPAGSRLAWFAGASAGFMSAAALGATMIGAILRRRSLGELVKALLARVA
jgi:hypothetical protein